MKIEKTTHLRPVSSIGKKKKLSQGSDEASATYSSISDVSTVQGIPENEMTPKVKHAIFELMGEVTRLNQELEIKNKRIDYLEKLADEDPLAPILNRRAFIRELSRSIDFAKRYNQPSSLIFIDVNNMKGINDQFGHSAGDTALTTIVDILLKNTRSTDIVGRLGGDEFGLILRQASKEIADQKVPYFSQLIQESGFNVQGTHIPLSASFGVHTFTGEEDPADILAAADSKMYEHKRNEKDQSLS